MGMREEEGGRLIRWMGEVQGSGSGSGSRGGLEGDGRDGGVYVDRFVAVHHAAGILIRYNHTVSLGKKDIIGSSSEGMRMGRLAS